MAGVWYGVVPESETTAAVEQASKSSRSRIMEVLSFKLVADAAVQPSLENGRKRQKLNHDLVLPASPRDWDNTVGDLGSNSQLNGDQE
ncbi:hypothetical protein Gorai_006206, partial [Gossypium raimondii]|nr:hypothetical protein [Gossypium raimondii]